MITRNYINWLESLPCNSRPLKVNQWMSEWAPLPNEIDIPRYEETQQRWIEHDCPDGVMGKLQRWMANSPN